MQESETQLQGKINSVNGQDVAKTHQTERSSSLQQKTEPSLLHASPTLCSHCFEKLKFSITPTFFQKYVIFCTGIKSMSLVSFKSTHINNYWSLLWPVCKEKHQLASASMSAVSRPSSLHYATSTTVLQAPHSMTFTFPELPSGKCILVILPVLCTCSGEIPSCP
jgi:hypothetical protein